jgi:tetratricopeptide (TPR) repeat protein
MASALLTVGTVSLWEGNHKEALDYLQNCLTLYRELKERVFTADALITIGQVYSATGNYAQSFNYYDQAMAILKVLNDKPRLEDLLTSMGTLYAEQGDYEKMVDYLNKALEIAREINDQMAIATILVNEGIAYREQGEYEKALKSLQESLRIAEEINSPGFTIYPQAALGAVYRLQGKYDQALDYLKRSLTVAEQVGDKAETATILFHLGELHNSRGDYVKAIEFSDRAASLSTQINLPQTCYLALTEKGKALRALKQPDQAQKSFLEAVATMEQLRSQVSGGEHDYQRFFQNRVSPYYEMIDLFIDRNDPAQALVYAERAKARVLLDVLRNGRVKVNKLMSREEQLEERRLYGDLISLNAQVSAERVRQVPDEARAKELEISTQKARNAYEEFQVSLYAAHPELKVKQGLLPQFAMQDASTLIPDNKTVLLEYACAGERTFLFVLTRDSRRQSKIEIKTYTIKAGRGALSKLVGNFRNLLAVNHPGFRQPGQRLYELLVKPIERHLSGKTTVCIVPDGPLWELPFQALQTTADKFLQELYAIYYAPSLQVL